MKKSWGYIVESAKIINYIATVGLVPLSHIMH